MMLFISLSCPDTERGEGSLQRERSVPMMLFISLSCPDTERGEGSLQRRRSVPMMLFIFLSCPDTERGESAEEEVCPHDVVHLPILPRYRKRGVCRGGVLSP